MALAKQAKPATKHPLSTITYSSLRKYNFVTAILFAIQGILVLVLSSSQKGAQPVTTNYLTYDKVASSIEGHSVAAAATHHLFDINMAYIIACFFFISALAHLIVAAFKHKNYEADLASNINRARWIEYALSASTMMVAIALLVGIYDFISLVLIFAFTAFTGLLGMLMELRNQHVRRVDWSNYSLGVAAGIIPWAAISFYFFAAHLYGNGISAYVYWIYWTMLALFIGFVLNMYFQFKKLGHWADYLFGERAYIILSLLAKTVLAWQIFAGALR